MTKFKNISETKLSFNLSATRKFHKIFPNQPSNPNHKTSNIMRLKSTSLTLAAAAVLAALPLANAQNVTATTDPVGFQSSNITVGINPIGLPLLNSDLVKASATSLTGSTLTLSGVSNVGSLLTSGEPYYIEVYSGSLKGDRFEVSVNATISAANSTLILDSTSPYNTTSVDSIGASLANATIALRKHITLDQVQAMFSPALSGSNTSSNADQISVFDAAEQNYKTYFLRADNVTWRVVGTTTSSNKVPIPPGMGIFLNKKSSPTTITQAGCVRTNDFALPYTAGLQLLAPGYPVGYSPSLLGGTTANNWTGSNTSSSADQIAVFNPSEQNFTSYFLRADGVTWRILSTTTNVTSTEIVGSTGAYFVIRKSADANNIHLPTFQ
jgi:hypothetical protein